MQKPALNSPHLHRQKTQKHTFTQSGCREYLHDTRCISFYFLPAVLLIHAGEALQASVACVKGCLEIFVDHHLLCSRVQHAEHLRRRRSERGAADWAEAASRSLAGRTAAHDSNLRPIQQKNIKFTTLKIVFFTFRSLVSTWMLTNAN